jgi:hypothetical protein
MSYNMEELHYVIGRFVEGVSMLANRGSPVHDSTVR